jgi:cytochrome c oxidase subunit III
MEIPYTTTPREDTGLYNAKVGIWLFLASEVMLFGALFSSYILLRVGADWWPAPRSILNIPIGTFNTAVLIISSVTVVLAWASLKMNRLDRFKIFQGITILCALIFVGVKSYEYAEKWKHYEVWLKDGQNFSGHIEVAGKQNPMFYNHNKLAAEKITEITVTKDPHKYGDPLPEKGHGEAATAEHATAEHAHESIVIKTSDIKRLSAFVPAHSTYFAIYFTLTGLHALHVIGGALVMFYLWITSGVWFKSHPEQFTNRIEVSGLFWHFVDLVWIFLFPILYLM